MDYIVETQFEGPGFVAVPNAVAQLAELSADALGVLVWLASLPKGFAVRRSTILERFRLGKDKWQRIARDLAAVGALELRKERRAGGQFASRYLVRWPDPARAVSPEPENPAPVQPEPENPPRLGGKSAKTGRETRPSKQNTKERHRRGGDPRPSQEPRHRSPLDSGGVGALSDLVRQSIRQDRVCVVAGVTVKSGSPEMERLRQAVRAFDAENRRAA